VPDGETKRPIRLFSCALTTAVLLMACADGAPQRPAQPAQPVPMAPQAARTATPATTASTEKLPKGYRRMPKNGQDYICRRETAKASHTEIVGTCLTQAEFDEATKNGQSFLQGLQGTPVQPPACVGGKAFTPGFWVYEATLRRSLAHPWQPAP
jgi:hypothetical protein